jgi:hypothetical protein
VLNVANSIRALALALALIILVSCSGKREREIPNRQKTVPVHGQVFLDGNPAQGVKVTLSPKGSPSTSGPSADVGEDGSFQISTYDPNDGAPAGEYVLIFTYKDPKAPLAITFDTPEPPDDFKGKYADPKKSQHRVTVPEDGPDVDVGRIDLKK